jgi:hypothetical protein
MQQNFSEEETVMQRDLRKSLLDLSQASIARLMSLKEKIMEIIFYQTNQLKTQTNRHLKLCNLKNEAAMNLKKELDKYATQKDGLLKAIKCNIQKFKGFTNITSQMDFENLMDTKNLTQNIFYKNAKQESSLEMDILLILPLSRQIIGM